MPTCMHAFVSGRVQGVWFRAATAEKAREIGVDGWVRNLPDGRVEVFAQGDDEALDELRAWLHQGPPNARVDAVEAEEIESAEAVSGFRIR
jgi:acylphosphatase